MTRKNKNGLIITIIFLMMFSLLIIFSSISGINELNELNYLIKNGREVEGNIIRYENTSGSTGTGWGSYTEFTLYYSYKENDFEWKTSQRFSCDRTGKSKSELENWCKEQVGKTENLIIADNRYCKIATELPSIYKETNDFVWIRGGILIGIETVLLIILLVIIFKVKVKDHLGNSL